MKKGNGEFSLEEWRNIYCEHCLHREGVRTDLDPDWWKCPAAWRVKNPLCKEELKKQMLELLREKVPQELEEAAQKWIRDYRRGSVDILELVGSAGKHKKKE